MGGYGSGRSGGRPTVEDSLSLNLPRFFKMGWLKPGASSKRQADPMTLSGKADTAIVRALEPDHVI